MPYLTGCISYVTGTAVLPDTSADFITYICFQIGDNWYQGECLDESGNTQGGGQINLGVFEDRDYGGGYSDGRAACFHNCQIFGMTGCQYDSEQGKCIAHTNPLVRRIH